MQKYNLKKLQHGSDIRGIAIEGVPDEQVNPTPEMATILGQAFVSWLVQKVNKSAAELTIAIVNSATYPGKS
ncbi:hypothetical protein QUA79_12130 [Microcoleus sp. F8-D1]